MGRRSINTHSGEVSAKTTNEAPMEPNNEINSSITRRGNILITMFSDQPYLVATIAGEVQRNDYEAINMRFQLAAKHFVFE